MNVNLESNALNSLKVFNFSESDTASDDTDAGSYLSHLLAISHSVFHHSGFDQIQVES